MHMFNALIRTHHITSRKKVAAIRKATGALSCHALLRSGSAPGIMYIEGTEEAVKEWVKTVQRLRYKDYMLVAKPGPLQDTSRTRAIDAPRLTGLNEVSTVKDFGALMDQYGVLPWWRQAMGYAA